MEETQAAEKWTLLSPNGDSQSESSGSSSEYSDFVKLGQHDDDDGDKQSDQASGGSAESSDFVKVDPEEEGEDADDLNYADEEEGITSVGQRSPIDQCSVSSIEILDAETEDAQRPLPLVISSSSIEELSEDEEVIPSKVLLKSSPSMMRRKEQSYEDTCSEGEDYVMLEAKRKAHPSLNRLRRTERKDSSGSDYSDFVRLDCDSNMEDLDSPSPGNRFYADRYTYPHDRARAKMVRMQMMAARRRYSSREDDADSLPSDVDDRCESDISGVAYDSDLSHRSIGDVPIEAGARSYKHRPNASLNTLLTTIALMALFGALGIGIGHYIGSVRELTLRQAQLAKMRSLQDDFVVCLQDQENLNRRLKMPSDKEVKLSTAVEIWQHKYEELVLEKADLMNRVHKLEESLGKGLEETNRQIQEYQAEAAQISEELNQLNADGLLEVDEEKPSPMPLELADARHEIARLRQRLMAKRSLDEREKVALNTLRNENADLKAEVHRMRYTADSLSQVISDEKQEETSPESEATIDDGLSSPGEDIFIEMETGHEEDVIPDAEKMDVPQSKMQQMFLGTKQRITEMFDQIQSTMQQVKERSREVFSETNAKGTLKSVKKTLKENVSNLGKTLRSAWKNFKKEDGSIEVDPEETTSEVPVTESDGSRLHQIVDATRERIAEVFDKIQTTVNKVAFEKKGLKNMGKTLKDNVSSLGKSLKKAWKSLSKEVAKKSEKWKMHEREYENIKETAHGKKDSERFHEDAFSYGGSAGVLHDVHEGGFEQKPHHKEKQATDAYSEFWKQADFTPEEYLPDDFFEGNQREWKNYQHRFNQMHGRLRHLNAEILVDMEDDDLDDLYDDLDDLQDDLEDEVDVPERLMAWLTCQLRWWKSRIHRKNGSENPLMGCARNLMKWQLHVSCHHASDCEDFFRNETVAAFEARSDWFFNRADERDVLRDLAWPLKRAEGRTDLRSKED